MELLLTFFSISSVMSQGVEQPKAFISASLGGFITERENFSKVYYSNLGLVFGAGLGLPLSNRMYLYGKVTYFSKTGVPVIYTYNYDQSGSLVSVKETEDGTAEYKQWIINGGLQYNVTLSEDFALDINSGITYTWLSEHQQSSNGSVGSSVEGTGVLGFFGGIAIEKNFRESPFSTFAETQYNYSRRSIVNVIQESEQLP